MVTDEPVMPVNGELCAAPPSRLKVAPAIAPPPLEIVGATTPLPAPGHVSGVTFGVTVYTVTVWLPLTQPCASVIMNE